MTREKSIKLHLDYLACLMSDGNFFSVVTSGWETKLLYQNLGLFIAEQRLHAYLVLFSLPARHHICHFSSGEEDPLNQKHEMKNKNEKL